jgi:hypothetical protein
MKPLLISLMTLVGCGTFEPVDMPGEGSLAGCLSSPSARGPAGVAVFIVSDGVAVRQTATDASGCFSFEAVASGRYLLVANDVRGLGFIEPVRLYADQRLKLPVRTLASLTLNPTLPTLRGVLSGEALGPVGNHDRLSCQDAAGTARLSSVTTNVLHTIDAQTGATTVTKPVVLAQLQPPPPRRQFQAFEEVVSLRWTDTTELVTPPFDGGVWRLVEATEQAFTADPYVDDPQRSGWRVGSRVFGAAGRVWVTQACQLVASGDCVRADVAVNAITFTRWSSQGPGAHTVPLAAGETAPWVQVSDDGVTWHVLVESQAGVAVWRVDQRGAPMVLMTFPGVRVKPTDPLEGILSGAPPSFLRSFRLEDVATGQRLWGRLDAEGSVALVPFPVWPAGARPIPDAPSSLTAPALQWVERVPPSSWRVTQVEHLGASTRTRTVILPDRDEPNYAIADTQEDSEYFPGFGFVDSTSSALSVLSTSRGLTVMEAGAPFETALPFSTLGLSVRPVCVVGNSLFAVGWGASDLRQQAWRYDIRRIADELARAP